MSLAGSKQTFVDSAFIKYFNPPSTKYLYIGTPLNQYNDYVIIQIPHEESFHSSNNMLSLK